MIEQDIKIIDNDKMLQNLNINHYKRYNLAFQREMEACKITKYVYKTDNAVFNKKENQEIPKVKCVFDLHTDKKSSFVTVYGNKDEIIFEGNYLWANPKENSYNDFIVVLKRLHDFKSIVNKFD